MRHPELNIGQLPNETSVIDGGRRAEEFPEDALPDGGRIIEILDQIEQ